MGSIHQFDKDIKKKDDHYESRLAYIFVTSASFEFSALVPEKLPELNYSLDPFILAHTNEVLVRNLDQPGVLIHMSFKVFAETISNTFYQHLNISVQPYHQALVLQDKIFNFTSVFDDMNVYVSKHNEDLDLFYLKMQSIIEQEQRFYKKMLSFIQILQSNDLLEVPPNVADLINHDANSTRRKRSFTDFLADIFTGYSLPNMASVAQDNYRKMNVNFANAQNLENQLRLSINKLAQRYGDLTHLQQTEVQMQFNLQIQHYLSLTTGHMLQQLDTIIRLNTLPSHILAVFRLINEQQYCDDFYCFVNPIFKVLNNTLFTTVQVQHLHLTKAAYVSCTLVGARRTSKYSNQIAFIDGDALVFKDVSLPRIQIDFLQNDQIDKATRLVTHNDLISGIIYPIYSKSLVSLQCLQKTMIIVDGQNLNCDLYTLRFSPIPSVIVVDGVPILQTILSHYLARHIELHMEQFHYNNEIFVPRRNMTYEIENPVETFFATATPLHYSMFASSGMICLLIFVIFCTFCYCRVPNILINLLCCFSPTCCFKRLVAEKIRSMARWSEPIVQGQEPESMNLNDNDGQPPNSRVNPGRLGTAARSARPVQSVQPAQSEQSEQSEHSGFRPFVPCLHQIMGCRCEGVEAVCKKIKYPTSHPIANRNQTA